MGKPLYIYIIYNVHMYIFIYSIFIIMMHPSRVLFLRQEFRPISFGYWDEIDPIMRVKKLNFVFLGAKWPLQITMSVRPSVCMYACLST